MPILHMTIELEDEKYCTGCPFYLNAQGVHFCVHPLDLRSKEVVYKLEDGMEYDIALDNQDRPLRDERCPFSLYDATSDDAIDEVWIHCEKCGEKYDNEKDAKECCTGVCRVLVL